jgi:hypothetical protein
LFIEPIKSKTNRTTFKRKSINFQALNQLIQELDQQKPQILIITRKLWLHVYGHNHIITNYSPGIGARILMEYIEYDIDIKNVIAFCNQLKFVQEGTHNLSVGRQFQQILNFKLHNLVKSLVLFRELKTAVNHNFSSEVKDEEQRLRAENIQHLTAQQYIIINDELKDA